MSLHMHLHMHMHMHMLCMCIPCTMWLPQPEQPNLRQPLHLTLAPSLGPTPVAPLSGQGA